MKVPLPENHYIKNIVVNDDGLDVEFSPRKKVALLFISLNDTYWPYLGQVLKDCRTNFLPQHKVDYFVWTDYNTDSKKVITDALDNLVTQFKESPDDKKQEAMNNIFNSFAAVVRLYEVFHPSEITTIIQALAQQGILFKKEGSKFWIESTKPLTPEDVLTFANYTRNIFDLSWSEMDKQLQGVTISETGAIQWPMPTLMRYHLFLQQEEKLKDYDYVFYLDADMRVVSKVSDEILNNGLLAAEHPMYSLRKEYIPPYEPNPNSTAYIHRTGRVVDENGKQRFKPYYYAGGFQGGTAKDFIKAMQTMKKNVDKDFDNNYTAIWNDESHWNKYLSDFKGDLAVMPPSYIYPDSLIKEYYEPLWGKSYEPKIITLTKPFSISAQGGEEINKFINDVRK